MKNTRIERPLWSMISQTFTFIDRRGNSPVYLQKWNYPHVSSAQTDVREGEQSFSSGVCRLVSLGPFIVRGRVTRTNVFLSFLMVFWRATDLSRTDQTGCPGTSSRWASFTRVWRSFNDGIVCMWPVCVHTHWVWAVFLLTSFQCLTAHMHLFLTQKTLIFWISLQH